MDPIEFRFNVEGKDLLTHINTRRKKLQARAAKAKKESAKRDELEKQLYGERPVQMLPGFRAGPERAFQVELHQLAFFAKHVDVNKTYALNMFEAYILGFIQSARFSSMVDDEDELPAA